MTESSAEKTKRNLLYHMREYEWKKQYCLFANLCLQDFEYDKVLGITVIPSKLNDFKEKLRKTFSDVAFLCILRAHAISNSKIRQAYGKSIHQLYICIYTSQVLDQGELNTAIASVYGEEAKLATPLAVTEQRLTRAHNTIRNQRLHNIRRLLPDFSGTKRWTVLNKKYLTLKKIL